MTITKSNGSHRREARFDPGVVVSMGMCPACFNYGDDSYLDMFDECRSCGWAEAEELMDPRGEV